VEVMNVEIKIVGAVSDENALDEIESIAKVFAYEQRMKDFTSGLQKQHLTKKFTITPIKKTMNEDRLLPTIKPHILVKGLC
jgi:hypothetical protein